MQVGSRGTSRGLYLCTDSFTLTDVQRLSDYLTETYNIRCSIHKAGGNHRVYILAKSIQTVRDLVLAHMHNSKLYLISLKEPTTVNNLCTTVNRQNPSLSIYSKSYQKRDFSTALFPKLEPNFITGFSDGESSFSISLIKRSASKAGLGILHSFSILIHNRDLALLHQIQLFFGVGTISAASKDRSVYRVLKIKDLTNVIIPHFNKYPLLTKKQADFSSSPPPS